MRFLSSRFRTAAEVLLTVAVLAYVAYDLVDRSGDKPTAVPEPSAAPSAAATAATSAVALNTAPTTASTARFDALVSNDVTSVKVVCGATNAPTNPWVIGTTTLRQALYFAGCPSTDAVLASTNLTYAGIWVQAGSWLVLQNILSTGVAVPGAADYLIMDPLSYVEAILPVPFTPSPYAVQRLDLLRLSKACPSFTQVNFTVANCLQAPTLAILGSYGCVLSAIPGISTCTITLVITGIMSAQATNYIAATLGLDCSTMTVAIFKGVIEQATGIPSPAIMVTYWQCASIVVYFTVLAGTVPRANYLLNVIFVSMSPDGFLNSAFQVISVAIVSYSSPRSNNSYTTSTIAYPYSYPYVLPYLVPYSESNPGLLALLTLLLIPVALAVALLLWCACRPVKKPVPPPCPCPAVPYMPLPTCMPEPCPCPCPPPVVCEPMCAPLMGSGTLIGGSPMGPAGGIPAF